MLSLLGLLPRAGAQALIPAAAPEGAGQAVLRHSGLEGRVLWLDGTANLHRLSSVEGVAAVLDRCVRAHINTVVVDIKPLSGHVLYESRIAPRLQEWRGFRYPPKFDLARTAIEEGRRRGLKIYLNLNVFSDGHKLVRSGPIYERPDQQSIIYDVERTVTTPRGARRTLCVGANRAPGPDELTVYETSPGTRRQVGPNEAFALVVSDRVEAVVDGALAPVEGILVRPDSYLLVGRGEAARWLLGAVRVGDALTWSAADRLIPIVDAPSESIAAFFNPAHPVSRDYLLRIVDELVTYYEPEGIVFDRMRYASIHSDFSELSRQKFEEYLGRKLNRFPGDIFSFDPVPGRPLVWGPYFKQWLEWRARNIRTWLEDARKIVRAKRPAAKLGVYVGSWYTTYYTVGVNWGSEDFMPGYEWMTATYPTTGYAHLLDWITTGCYHPIATREQARTAGVDETFTVQAAAERSVQAVADSAFVYAGIYALDYRTSPEVFREAMRAAREYSHGVMLFDLSQIEDYGWWRVIEEELAAPRTAPHDVPELLQAVRALRRSLNSVAYPTLP